MTLIEHLQKKYEVKQKGDWIILDCPFCSDTHQHYAINIKTLVGNCFRCGSKSPKRNISFYKIPRSIYSSSLVITGCEIKESIDQEFDISVEDLGFPIHSALCRKYLNRKRVDFEKATERCLLEKNGMMIIPFIKRNEIISYYMINLRTNEKYHPPIKPGCKDLLYGEDFVFGNTVLVVESPLCVIRYGTNCVALCGNVASENQLKELYKYKKVILALDGPRQKSEIKTYSNCLEIKKKLERKMIECHIHRPHGDICDLYDAELKKFKECIYEY